VHLGGAPGTNDVFRVHSDGSESVRLTQDADATHPGISGDGETIVFDSWEDLTGQSCGIVQVFAIQADGTGLRQLSPTDPDCTGPLDWASHPAISAGGTVVYQSDDGIVVTAAAGGTPILVAPDPSSQPKKPRISQSGNWVAYGSGSNPTGQNPEGSHEIFRVRADGTDLEQITDDAQHDSYWPDLSAEGGQIVYVSRADPLGRNPDHNGELFVYSPATGLRRQLTETTEGDQYEPRIDGSGRSVVFLSSSPLPGHVRGVFYDVFRVDVESGRITRVTGDHDPRQRSVFPAGSRNNPEYAIDDRGRIVFTGAGDPTGGNPDLSYEIWSVEPAVDSGRPVHGDTGSWTRSPRREGP
jgi:hypothetical protein